MSLLDTVISGLMNHAGGASGIQSTLMNMLSGSASGNPQGGVSGIVSQLEQAGLGHIAQTWIGNGPNQTIQPEQLQHAFGQKQVQDMAEDAGMQPHDFLSQLAQHLPQVIDSLTPHGKLPDEGTLSV